MSASFVITLVTVPEGSRGAGSARRQDAGQVLKYRKSAHAETGSARNWPHPLKLAKLHRLCLRQSGMRTLAAPVRQDIKQKEKKIRQLKNQTSLIYSVIMCARGK